MNYAAQIVSEADTMNTRPIEVQGTACIFFFHFFLYFDMQIIMNLPFKKVFFSLFSRNYVTNYL